MKQERIDANQLELTEKVVSIKRVTKVVKGGRNMRFTALVVVGDGNGCVAMRVGWCCRCGRCDEERKHSAGTLSTAMSLEIGRASCRERV